MTIASQADLGAASMILATFQVVDQLDSDAFIGKTPLLGLSMLRTRLRTLRAVARPRVTRRRAGATAEQ